MAMADDDSPDSAAAAKAGLDIDWVRTIAGALAAITTAVLLSTLGAAGTLIGAALGSVAATVATAVYSQGLARSKARLAAAQERALHKVDQAQSEVRRAARRGDASRLPRAERKLAEAADELGQADLDDGAAGSADDASAGSPAWRERLADLPWKRIALVAAGLFVLVVVVISIFEALTGRTVSSYTGGSDRDGGTTITRITGGGSSSSDDGSGGGGGGRGDESTPADPTDSPSTDPSGTASPTPDPTDDVPTDEPTTDPTTDPADPTPAPTSSPTAPLPSPTATP